MIINTRTISPLWVILLVLIALLILGGLLLLGGILLLIGLPVLAVLFLIGWLRMAARKRQTIFPPDKRHH